MRPLALFFGLAVLSGGAGLAQQLPGETVGDPLRGLAFAKTECAQCHAIDDKDASAVPTAPAFRDLPARYDVGGLGEAFAEGISVGDPMMPEHMLEPDEIDDLIAWLRTFAPAEGGLEQ